MEEQKLQELYSGSRAGTATGTSSRSGDEYSVKSGSVTAKPLFSPKVLPNNGRVVPISEEIDDTYDDGGFLR